MAKGFGYNSVDWRGDLNGVELLAGGGLGREMKEREIQEGKGKRTWGHPVMKTDGVERGRNMFMCCLWGHSPNNLLVIK